MCAVHTEYNTGRYRGPVVHRAVQEFYSSEHQPGMPKTLYKWVDEIDKMINGEMANTTWGGRWLLPPNLWCLYWLHPNLWYLYWLHPNLWYLYWLHPNLWYFYWLHPNLWYFYWLEQYGTHLCQDQLRFVWHWYHLMMDYNSSQSPRHYQAKVIETAVVNKSKQL